MAFIEEYTTNWKNNEQTAFETLTNGLSKNNFKNDPTFNMLQNNLINIYENYELFKHTNKPSGIKEESIILNEIYKKKLETRLKHEYCVVDKENFIIRFNKLTNNLLNFIDWQNVAVAGGVINLALSHEPIEELEKNNYDIDVFIYGVSEVKAKKIINNIYDSFKDIITTSKCIKTKNTITIINVMPYRHIQFVLNIFQNVGNILHNFDLQSSKVLFDGENVYTTIDGHFALSQYTNIYNNNLFDNSAFVSRLYKYNNRGYQVCIPNFDKNKVSNNVYKSSDFNTNVTNVTNGDNTNGDNINNTNDTNNNSIKKLLHFDKFGKNYSNINENNILYLNDTNYIRKNLTSYSSVLFMRNTDINKIIENLEIATTRLLFTLKIRTPNDKITKKNASFKVIDIRKFPIYKKFDNIKFALIDENNYDNTIDIELLMNGQTFTKSDVNKYLMYNNNIEYLMTNYINLEKYYTKIHKNAFNKTNYDDLYYDEEIDTYINKIKNIGNIKDIEDIDTYINKIKNIGNIKDIEDIDFSAIKNINNCNKSGNTLMKYSITIDNTSIVEKLLIHKFDIYKKMDEGMTYIHYAIKHNKYEIVKIFIKHMKDNKINTIKFYDNSGCNLIHCVIMYGTHDMFVLFNDNFNIPLSDISWSFKFNNEDMKKYKTYSKYICCAKLCMMYNQMNILQSILEMYNNYNDFRYIFVDSNLTTADTSDIVNFTINSYNHVALGMLFNFFNKNNISTIFTNNIINNINDIKNINNLTNCDGSKLETIFMLSQYDNEPKIIDTIILTIQILFNNNKYSEMLHYIGKWIPNLWTNKKYNKIHDIIKFENVFGNKYVDTERGLQLFSSIQNDDWITLDKLLEHLQYNLYIYAVNNDANITVLSLCHNDSQKITKVLSYINKSVSNKTNTYTKNIYDLLFINNNNNKNNITLNTYEIMLKNDTHKYDIACFICCNINTIVKQIMTYVNDFVYGELKKFIITLSFITTELNQNDTNQNNTNQNNTNQNNTKNNKKFMDYINKLNFTTISNNIKTIPQLRYYYDMIYKLKIIHI